MDPVTQTLAQQQSGSAGGQGFGNYFMGGVQARQEGQRLNLATQRLALEQAQENRLQERQTLLLGVEKKMREMELAQIGQTIRANEFKLEAMTELNSALPEIYELRSHFMRSPLGHEDPALIERAQGLARKYVRAFAPGAPGGDLLTEIEGAMALNHRFLRLQKMNEKLSQQGQYVSGFNPKTGQIDLGTVRATTPANVQEAAAVTNLRRRIAAESDPERKADLELELNDLLTQTAPAGTTTEVMGPDGNVLMRTTTGRQAGATDAPTIATRTMAQRNMVETEKTVTLLNDLQAGLTPGDVGIRGVVGEKLFDRLLPQFGFDTANVERMDSRTKLKMLVESALKQVSVDSRFSDRDRIDIKEVLPKTGLLETYEHANTTIDVLRRVFSKRALIDAKTMNIATPQWAVEALDVLGLSEAVRSGLLTKEEAVQEFDRRQPKE